MLTTQTHKPRRSRPQQPDMIGYAGLTLDDCGKADVQAYEEDLPLFIRVTEIMREQENRKQVNIFEKGENNE